MATKHTGRDSTAMPVLPWLESVASHTSVKEGPDGAVRWAAPSASGLEKRLRGSREIDIFVPRIAGEEDRGNQMGNSPVHQEHFGSFSRPYGPHLFGACDRQFGCRR